MRRVAITNLSLVTGTRRIPQPESESESGPEPLRARRPWVRATRIDEAAACMYALQHEVLAAQNIPIQGIGREPYRS